MSELRWIPVTERLPDNERVICFYKTPDGGCVDLGFYGKKRGGWTIKGATHWMPLPDPPEVRA